MQKIALQGILFDEKSSYLRGPALAPPLIRKAYHNTSANYFSENGMEILPELWDDKGAVSYTHLTLPTILLV